MHCSLRTTANQSSRDLKRGSSQNLRVRSDLSRQPGTLKALAASWEKRSLALLAPWGINHAGVSLNAAKQAQLKVISDKAHAMRQTALFHRAGGSHRHAQ